MTTPQGPAIIVSGTDRQFARFAPRLREHLATLPDGHWLKHAEILHSHLLKTKRTWWGRAIFTIVVFDGPHAFGLDITKAFKIDIDPMPRPTSAELGLYALATMSRPTMPIITSPGS